MITEDEAFWAGIAVATMMLGGGFSMLFLHAYTGYGAIVLSLGLMTMALTIQMRAKPIEYVENLSPFESCIPIPASDESQREPEETQPSSQPLQDEARTEQEPSEPYEEPVKSEEPSEHVEPTEPTEPTQPVETPTEAPQPSQPQTPTEEPIEPPSEEKPKEEPQVVTTPN